MDSKLVAGFKTQKDKETFIAEFQVSELRQRLEKIVQDKITSVDKSAVEDYNIPNWAAFKADQVGYIRALTEVLTLLKTK